jgi:hypothetical protein
MDFLIVLGFLIAVLSISVLNMMKLNNQCNNIMKWDLNGVNRSWGLLMDAVMTLFRDGENYLGSFFALPPYAM